MRGARRYRFDAELWEWEAQGGWFFVSLPDDVADTIEALSRGVASRGFGSVPVEVTMGKTTWRTSIFPDKKRGTYVLPIKKAVRKAEDVDVGATVTVLLTVSRAQRD